MHLGPSQGPVSAQSSALPDPPSLPQAMTVTTRSSAPGSSTQWAFLSQPSPTPALCLVKGQPGQAGLCLEVSPVEERYKAPGTELRDLL